MTDSTTRQKNIQVYAENYNDPCTYGAYEVRDKLLIFSSILNSLKHFGTGRVLDVGFGTGDLLIHCARKGYECYGIDVVSSAATILRERSNYPLNLFTGEATKLPFDSDYFDLVVCSHVLEHIENDALALSEIKRVLKKSGLAILGVPSFGSRENELHYREYSRVSFAKLINGWQVFQFAGYGSWLLQSIMLWRNALTHISRANDAGNKCVAAAEGSPRFRMFYQAFMVPALLFLLYLDNKQPFFKGNPMEIWAVIRKIQNE